ncbi:MAG: DNA cytosine methyltransferase [Bryobacteraceae bacterium]
MASDFGVPQLRPRVVFIAAKKEYAEHFSWPEKAAARPPHVATEWARRAGNCAPKRIGRRPSSIGVWK